MIPSRLLAQLGEPGDGVGQELVVAAGRGPAVAEAGRPADGGVAVTTDDDRDRLRGHRAELDGLGSSSEDD